MMVGSFFPSLEKLPRGQKSDRVWRLMRYIAAMMTRKILAMMALVFSLVVPIQGAEAYKVGSKVKSFTTKDQFGRAYTFQKGTKFLLVSFDMKSGKAANGKLSALGGKYLPSKKAVFIADIFGMPGIGRHFAFKKMKKYKHTIVLGDDENLLTAYPRKEGKITVLKLDSAAKITKISYWTPGVEKVDSLLK